MLRRKLFKNVSAAGFCSVLLLAYSSLYAQTRLSEVISAEKSFAKYSVEHSTQEAFVKFMGDSSIVFNKGKVFNGKTSWTARKPNAAQLNWYPSFAMIAPSGEMGCTSGPWEFRSNKTDTVAAGWGHFATIWEKQANGEWKVKLDIGIQHDKQAQREPEAKPGDTEALSAKKIKGDLIAVEKEFIVSANSNAPAAYASYLANDTRIFRPGELPELSLRTIKDPAAGNAPKYSFTLIDGATSMSADFGYTYGSVAITADNKTSDGNYFRVWKKENGKWKIVLDLVAG